MVVDYYLTTSSTYSKPTQVEQLLYE